jgi:hypothetical protein
MDSTWGGSEQAGELTSHPIREQQPPHKAEGAGTEFIAEPDAN